MNNRLNKCGHCNQIFRYNELIERKEILYGHQFVEKACPFCGSTGYTALSEEHRYDKYFYQMQI